MEELFLRVQNAGESEIIVNKKNIHGQVVWRYLGKLIERAANYIVLEAFFDRQDMDLHGLFLGKGDRFVETWYTDRWYNIFEIHAREDDHLRGWYCNIGCPAEFDGNTISYIDLSLDLLVFPDGRQIILDEDEFAALELPPEMRQQALQALLALKADFQNRTELLRNDIDHAAKDAVQYADHRGIDGAHKGD